MVGVKRVRLPRADLPVLLSTVLSSAVIVLMSCVVIVTPQDDDLTDPNDLSLNEESVSANDTPCSQDDPQLGSTVGGTAVGGLLFALLAFLLGMLAGAAAHHCHWAASHTHKGEEPDRTYLPMTSTAAPQGTWGDLGDVERYHAHDQEEGVASHPIDIPLNSAHCSPVGGGAAAMETHRQQSHQGLEDENVLTSAHHDIDVQLYDTIPECMGDSHLPTRDGKREDYVNVNANKLQMRPQLNAHSCDDLFERAFSAQVHMTRSVEGLNLQGRGQEWALGCAQEERGHGQGHGQECIREERGHGQGEEQLYEDVGGISGPLAGGIQGAKSE